MAKTQVLDIVPASKAHADFMIAHLYPSDEAEVKAHGCSVEFAIKVSFDYADQVWVAVSPDGPVCMWGITKAKTLLGSASAWLLTSKLIDKYSRPFIRQVRPYFADLMKQHPLIENYVDSRHERALKFYEWLGFEVEDGILVGPQQIPFHKICYRSLHGS